MVFFLCIMHEVMVDLSAATDAEDNNFATGRFCKNTQLMNVISWYTDPAVYRPPMLGPGVGTSVVVVQLGYCVSDIISKCGVGLVEDKFLKKAVTPTSPS